MHLTPGIRRGWKPSPDAFVRHCCRGDPGEQPGLVSPRRAIHTDQLSRHLRLCLQGGVDALCQGRKVGIKRTDHNTSMPWCGMMQSNEMPPIEREHNPLLCNGKCQHVCIRHRLPRPATIGGCEDIVAHVPQGLHCWQGKVFVRIAPRHPSRRFVRMDLLLDLLSVGTGIGPCIGKILCPQCGIAPQEIGFTGAKVFGLD